MTISIESTVIENVFGAFKRETGLIEQAVADVSSIDLKAGEPGLNEFAGFHGFPFRTFSAEELGEVEGDFSGSDFVKETVGVDCVCERAAVKASGGQVLIGKYAKDGVTLAASAEAIAPDWRWKDE